MSLKHGILGLLNYGPQSGYNLDKIFKGSLNYFWQAQTSQIYRELGAMVKAGWIVSEIVLQTDKPNKRLFSLTEPGRAELYRWLGDDTLEEDIRIRDPFLVKLFFSGELPTEANIETLRQFSRCCGAILAGIEKTSNYCDILSKSNPKAFYWGTTAHFGLYYYDMCIRWAEDTIKKLEALS